MNKAELSQLLDDEDVKEQAKQLYLDALCGDILPDINQLSSRYNLKTLIAGVAYDANYTEQESGLLSDFFTIIEALIPDMAKIKKRAIEDNEPAYAVKADYMKIMFEHIKDKASKISAEIVDDFPKRLKKARDALTKYYKAEDDISYKELFEDLIYQDSIDITDDMLTIINQYASISVLKKFPNSDEKEMELIEKERKHRGRNW